MVSNWRDCCKGKVQDTGKSRNPVYIYHVAGLEFASWSTARPAGLKLGDVRNALAANDWCVVSAFEIVLCTVVIYAAFALELRCKQRVRNALDLKPRWTHQNNPATLLLAAF